METDQTKIIQRREWRRADYQRNKAARLAQQKVHRAANVEIIAARDSARKKRAREQDPEKFRARNKAWSAANTEKVKAKTNRWLEKNSARKKETNRLWKLANADKVRDQSREWWTRNRPRANQYARKRMATPKGKIENAVRSGIYTRLSRDSARKGTNKTFALLGYRVEQLVAHLERQFSNGMNWENYGDWHVDHIIPIAAFNYETVHDADFKAAWALTNLRPMWAEKNLSKGAKRLTLL